MCGIIGYTGQKEAYPLLVAGLERLEYRGYGSFTLKFPSFSNLKTKDYKEKNEANLVMDPPNQKYNDIPNYQQGMNVLYFMKFEDYYCQITPSFQKRLREKTKNYLKISQRINTSHKTVGRMVTIEKYWMNFKTILNLCRLLGVDNLELYSNITSIKTHNSFPLSFNLKDFISPSFFRIMGHILGDGGIHVIEKEGKYRAFYTNNQDILLKSFAEDSTNTFGDIKLYYRERKNYRVSEVWMPTTVGYLLYNIFNYKNLNKRKRVPKFLFEINDRVLLGSFLQALYDDEGFLYPQKRMIVIAQKSRELIEDIRQIVIKLGIIPNQILIHRSKTKTTMFYFSITHKDNFILFNKYIGFIHPIKKEKLKLLMQKYPEE